MIRLAQPNFDASDLQRIKSVLDSGWLVQGKMVRELESLISEYLGTPVLAVSSGTAALHLALLTLDLAPGAEVLVPAFTWPATANVVVQCGATPVFVDVDAETFAITADAVIAARTERTAAIIPVHLFGIPAPVEAITAACPDLPVIEDAACALGTELASGAFAGTHGAVGCFSLHPRKSMTTGEGGFICADSDERLARIASLRNHGIVTGLEGYAFHEAGLNYRMSDITAAVGIGQAGRYGSTLAQRKLLGHRYVRNLCEQLRGFANVHVPDGLASRGNAFQAVVVDVGSAERRQQLRQRLRDDEIETTIGTYCVPAQPYFTGSLGTSAEDYPNATAAMNNLLALPIHTELTVEDVDTVCNALVQHIAALP